jgi:hypothetical protein
VSGLHQGWFGAAAEHGTSAVLKLAISCSSREVKENHTQQQVITSQFTSQFTADWTDHTYQLLVLVPISLPRTNMHVVQDGCCDGVDAKV